MSTAKSTPTTSAAPRRANSTAWRPDPAPASRTRFPLTSPAFANAGDVSGKRVLDAGAGSGRHAVEFARRGAAEVVGVDFAVDMLALANRSEERRVGKRRSGQWRLARRTSQR